MNKDELEKFYNNLAQSVEHEFINRKLSDHHLINFYLLILAQLLEWTISDTEYSKETINQTLKELRDTLKATVKKGFKLRKEQVGKEQE